MSFFISLQFFLLLGSTCSQNSQNVDTWIKSIFNTSTPMPNEGNPCGFEKECVPFYLCNNGEVNTNGEELIDIRGSDNNDPCSYLETCCEISKKTSNSIIITKPRTELAGCGIRNPDGVGFRITGNQNNEAEFGEFPWVVAILKYKPTAGEDERIYECGGSLIAPTVVLTAAHCVIKYTADALIARAGEWDSKSIEEVLPHQDQRVREIIVHESFNPGALHNDIALLIVETAFEFADNVRPICLPPAGFTFDHSRCYANGWGKNKFGRDGLYQVILSKIDLPIIPHDTCQANLRKTRLSRHFQLHNSFLCAGGEAGKDTCEGDGGSPLVCPIVGQTDRFYQAGIVAWGLDCGVVNVPGVYVSVAQLRPWIDEKFTEKGLDLSYSTP